MVSGVLPHCCRSMKLRATRVWTSCAWTHAQSTCRYPARPPVRMPFWALTSATRVPECLSRRRSVWGCICQRCDAQSATSNSRQGVAEMAGPRSLCQHSLRLLQSPTWRRRQGARTANISLPRATSVIFALLGLCASIPGSQSSALRVSPGSSIGCFLLDAPRPAGHEAELIGRGSAIRARTEVLTRPVRPPTPSGQSHTKGIDVDRAFCRVRAGLRRSWRRVLQICPVGTQASPTGRNYRVRPASGSTQDSVCACSHCTNVSTSGRLACRAGYTTKWPWIVKARLASKSGTSLPSSR